MPVLESVPSFERLSRRAAFLATFTRFQVRCSLAIRFLPSKEVPDVASVAISESLPDQYRWAMYLTFSPFTRNEGVRNVGAGECSSQPRKLACTSNERDSAVTLSRVPPASSGANMPSLDVENLYRYTIFSVGEIKDSHARCSHKLDESRTVPIRSQTELWAIVGVITLIDL